MKDKPAPKIPTGTTIYVEGLADHLDGFDSLKNLIQEKIGDTTYPFTGETTGDHGDFGQPMIKLKNGNIISTRYLQIAD